MTNSALLRAALDSNHISICELAKALGVARYTIYKKISNRTEFKASEIQKMSDMLQLNEADKTAIFFAPNVD